MLIGIANTKGGCAKTTITIALAVHAAETEEKTVALIDADPQESLTIWHRARGGPDNPALLARSRRPSQTMARHAMAYDHVIVDGPPGSLLIAEDIIAACDVVVIPVRPSAIDMGAMQACLALCNEQGVSPIAVLADVTTRDAKLVEAARAALDDCGVPACGAVMVHRMQYINAYTTGQSGGERDKRAADEIAAIWSEVVDHAQ